MKRKPGTTIEEAGPVAPDYIQPVVGWRFWRTVSTRESLALSSIFWNVHWPADEPLRASCMRTPLHLPFPRLFKRELHEAPGARCECGIYAVSRPASVAFGAMVRECEQHTSCPVIGRVLLWGSVHEHEQGWRGTFAYPERLYVWQRPRGGGAAVDADRVADGLERYGVPVEIVLARPEELVAALTDESQVLAT
jgi:hypothetical protein